MSRLLLTAVLLLAISPCYSQLAVYVRDSIAAGQYGDAEDAIQKRLAAEPNDVDAHYMLVLLYLKARQPLAARPAFDALRALAGANPHAKELADQLEPFLPPPPIPTEQVKALTAELNRYRATAAAKAVDRMTIGAQQKEIIKLYLDLYQARFVSGLTRLQKLAGAGGLGAEEAQGLRQEINAMTGDYTSLNARLNEFLLSPLANGACTPESARSAVQAQNLLLEEYARVASNAVSAFPLNGRFLDLGFHAMLLVGGYDELEKFGDLVLLAKGEIRVPFFSRDSLFSLVIDEAGQRLYTDANKSVAGNPAGSDGMETMTAFDLPFARIAAIRQRAQSDLTTQGLAAKSYCLRLEPEGLAPHYAFMPLLHCLYGEEAQKRSTANLGRFILHVARDTQIRATLVDPGKQTKDVFNGVMNKLAIGSMAGAVMSLGSGGLGNLQMAADSVRQGVGILKGTAEERNRMRTIQAGQAQAREGWQNELAERIVTTLMVQEMSQRFPQLDAYLDELGKH